MDYFSIADFAKVFQFIVIGFGGNVPFAKGKGQIQGRRTRFKRPRNGAARAGKGKFIAEAAGKRGIPSLRPVRLFRPGTSYANRYIAFSCGAVRPNEKITGTKQ
jgi:hypothetical protein